MAPIEGAVYRTRTHPRRRLPADAPAGLQRAVALMQRRKRLLRAFKQATTWHGKIGVLHELDLIRGRLFELGTEAQRQAVQEVG